MIAWRWYAARAWRFCLPDELIEPGLPLGPGQIYNSNRRVLCSWLARMGCEVIDAGILPDDLEQTRARLGGLGSVDLILSTGGVSDVEPLRFAVPVGFTWQIGRAHV